MQGIKLEEEMKFIFKDNEEVQKLISEGLITVNYKPTEEFKEELQKEGKNEKVALTKEQFNDLVQAGKILVSYDTSNVPFHIWAKLLDEEKAICQIKIDNEWVLWNPAKTPDPRLPEGANGGSKEDTCSRWHLQYHPKGIYYQSVIKQTMEKVLEILNKASCHPLLFKFGLSKIEPLIVFIYNGIQTKYDSNAYEFKDKRLQTLNTFCRVYMSANFQEDEGVTGRTRKLELSNMCINIPFNLCKEDLYYRARMLDFLGKLRQLPDWVFELDELEKGNIREWH